MKLPVFFRGALLVLWLALGLSSRARAEGFPLPLHNGGTWGKSPAGLVADIEKSLRDGGFLDAIEVAGLIADGLAHGKVPAVEDLAGTLDGDVKRQVEEAVAQATDATQLLGLVDVTAMKQLFTTL